MRGTKKKGANFGKKWYSPPRQYLKFFKIFFLILKLDGSEMGAVPLEEILEVSQIIIIGT